jgi:hypothetical protein
MMRFLNNPRKCWYLFPLALLGFAADILMNYTTIPAFLDKAWAEEWTFSTRLERLCSDETVDPGRKAFYLAIALEVNRVAGFAHIQNAAKYKLTIQKAD